jgi:hypothetical protein
VYFEFHPGGRVEVVLVEVKDYSHRRVPLGDFTAVTGDILEGNLARLRQVVGQKGTRLPVELQTLTPKQLRNLRAHLNQALKAGAGLTLEVRLGATTGLGGKKQRRRQDAALAKLQKMFSSRDVRHEARLSAREVDLAARITEVELPPASAARLLDTHAQLAEAKLVDDVLEPILGQPGLFTGKSGRVSTFRAVTTAEFGARNPDRKAIEAAAADVLKELNRRVKVPGKPAKDLEVVLDLSGLEPRVAARLNAAVNRALAATDQANVLNKRLHRRRRRGRIDP